MYINTNISGYSDHALLTRKADTVGWNSKGGSTIDRSRISGIFPPAFPDRLRHPVYGLPSLSEVDDLSVRYINVMRDYLDYGTSPGR